MHSQSEKRRRSSLLHQIILPQHTRKQSVHPQALVVGRQQLERPNCDDEGGEILQNHRPAQQPPNAQITVSFGCTYLSRKQDQHTEMVVYQS